MSITVGIDCRLGRYLAAEVHNESGRLQIGRLLSIERGQPSDLRLPEGSSAVLSIPDAEVIVKSLQVPAEGEGSLEDRMEFELAHCLLEQEESFRFRFHPIDDKGRYLGFVFRRESLEKLSRGCGFLSESGVARPDFRMRSLALGKAYLAFCRKGEGDLVCLADLTDTEASICLIYRQSIVDLAFLSVVGRDLSSTDERQRLAVDLKTVINFRLAMLFDRGVSKPLSGMILSGDGVDSELRRTVQEYFPTGVRSPELHAGFLPESSEGSSAEFEPHLVALGLTVN